MPTAKIKTVRMGPVTVEFEEGVASKDLKSELEKLDMRTEGSTVWINGTRLASSEVANATIKPDDEVRVAAKADQG